MATTRVQREPSAREMRQRRSASQLLGPDSVVSAVATGRAPAQWSGGATFVTSLFAAAFLLVLVLFNRVLIPGGLIFAIVYETVRPTRAVAVTTTGVALFKVRVMNGLPSSVLATEDFDVLAKRRPESSKGKAVFAIGDEAVTLKDRDLKRLLDTIPRSNADRGEGFPPPPSAPWTVDPDVGAALPGWRQATALWVLAHLGVGIALFVAILLVSAVPSDLLGRDTSDMADGAWVYLWGVLAGVIGGWLLFVYRRAPLRSRLLLFGACTGTALLLAWVVTYVFSPPSLG
jgi:hypothetical protein